MFTDEQKSTYLIKHGWKMRANKFISPFIPDEFELNHAFSIETMIKGYDFVEKLIKQDENKKTEI